MTKGVSISSNLILECSKRKIDIDFIEKSRPYAQITYYENISNELHLKQIDIKNSKKGFKTAVAITKMFKSDLPHQQSGEKESINL